MTNDTKLKPCPFCGGTVSAYHDNLKKIMISCDQCGAMIGVSLEIGVELINGWTANYKTLEDAVKAWNNRV